LSGVKKKEIPGCGYVMVARDNADGERLVALREERMECDSGEGRKASPRDLYLSARLLLVNPFQPHQRPFY